MAEVRKTPGACLPARCALGQIQPPWQVFNDDCLSPKSSRFASKVILTAWYQEETSWTYFDILVETRGVPYFNLSIA
jgi:hypothetical protein